MTGGGLLVQGIEGARDGMRCERGLSQGGARCGASAARDTEGPLDLEGALQAQEGPGGVARGGRGCLRGKEGLGTSKILRRIGRLESIVGICLDA